MLYDRQIREPLFDFLEKTYGKVRILEEKRTGSSRADVVMVLEGAVAGIEIKSDADTYARLAGQVADYDQYYDFNYVVVGTSHAMHIEEHVPEWWGIITVESGEGGPDFYLLRRPKHNPRMELEKKLTLLWRPELQHILAVNGLHEYKRESKAFVRGKILEKVPEEALHQQISEELFERDYTKIFEQINAYRLEIGKKPRRRRRRRTKRKT